NATALAQWLSEHEDVSAVHYPGYPGTDPRQVLGRELLGPGSTLAFELKTVDANAPARFLAALRMITPAVSLGCTDTLIQHPASLTHRVVDPTVRDEHGINAQMLRLSVGVEYVDDIRADLERGLQAASGALNEGAV